jgi:S-adenosylmethionine:tRNA ribosyltransferase-isomerase
MPHPLEKYNYTLEEKHIRKSPLTKRDSSRLFVYNTATDTITFDHFYNIANYLPKDSLLVRNVTGVIPARVTFTKDTGGKVGGLVLINEGVDSEGNIPVIVDRKIEVGRTLHLGSHTFTVVRQDEQKFFLKPHFPSTKLHEVLLQEGTTPTPFYLGKQTLAEDELRTRYQTIFAQEKNSVAAPTASLHFTEDVFTTLKEKNIATTDIVLDVGMGTFGDVTEEQWESKKLHQERIFIGTGAKNQIAHYKRNSKPIIAVGTTVTRTLEGKYAEILSDDSSDISGVTDLFITPPYNFQLVDILITNFHVPKSSLMALVDAFLLHKGAKRRILELYNVAQENGFTFYSFGDSMLII